jgi:hypothetical protein
VPNSSGSGLRKPACAPAAGRIVRGGLVEAVLPLPVPVMDELRPIEAAFSAFDFANQAMYCLRVLDIPAAFLCGLIYCGR